MSVRTRVAGIKNKRRVDPHAAQPSVQASKGRKTLAHDDAAALLRQKELKRVTLGPAAGDHGPKRNNRGTGLRGRKKAPSQIHIKRAGGPRERSRLHGG
ncbi:hypothetical protein HRD49_36065 [Corallococcus exiguus]|uniref:Uncharacterized protein n=1 Tax=Corallococcus exiguus TaxID=83462 RepID=A0A7Y1WPC9_9BACT|nr:MULTISPECIES: hypothetical protein [Corallococcus]NBC38350.1 hypothetical protein [Corallococcus exiguus]NNB87302.1 hypothetical protein [Corallococcus exiguus]NNB98029.1 hypothetical protein [Corallococcus exiguus]NNC06920.1 hypothetical protein [Corallococcus exiguus]NNC19240.1 hypothetical protein [Corallococcus exiguus]